MHGTCAKPFPLTNDSEYFASRGTIATYNFGTVGKIPAAHITILPPVPKPSNPNNLNPYLNFNPNPNPNREKTLVCFERQNRQLLKK